MMGNMRTNSWPTLSERLVMSRLAVQETLGFVLFAGEGADDANAQAICSRSVPFMTSSFSCHERKSGMRRTMMTEMAPAAR